MQNIDRLSWERLSPLLDRALDLDAAERTAFLASVRTSAPELADRLEALMAAHARVANSDFLAQGPGGVVEALRPDLTGQTIGAYTLDRKLGQGGMGAVWLAHRSDGRFSGQVALKLVNHAVFDATARDRFEREGTILARLSHPNISRLLDAGVTTAGQPYLVLEYVEGTHIDDYADRHRLDVTARLGLFLQVAEAVAHAHENLVVHRDLKPSNILVRPDGTVKLLDFGIAKLLTDEASNAAADASHATALVLTPKYAAPEQVREGIVSTVTDVYALGVLLFLLLAGRHPTAPEASSAADYLRAIERQPDRIDAVLRAIANDAAQATRIAEARGTTIERLQRRCSGELETILTVALRTDPADRYRSVAAFADDIRRHLRREPVSVQPDSWWYRTSRLIARRRLESVAAAVTAVGILAGAGVAVWQARVAQQQRDRALVAEAEARALNTYLVDELLTASTPERAQGQPVSVADVLGRASRSVGYAFADRPMLEAHMRATLARSYLAIGALGEAARTAPPRARCSAGSRRPTPCPNCARVRCWHASRSTRATTPMRDPNSRPSLRRRRRWSARCTRIPCRAACCSPAPCASSRNCCWPSSRRGARRPTRRRSSRPTGGSTPRPRPNSSACSRSSIAASRPKGSSSGSSRCNAATWGPRIPT